ncbi:MAG: hypothetical protein QOC57_2346 [Ilumatobacteraceae bacterium]|jgi:hypothetical protein|nr:hypothetical protein [Ilumatobacteraceae bacterium]
MKLNARLGRRPAEQRRGVPRSWIDITSEAEFPPPDPTKRVVPGMDDLPSLTGQLSGVLAQLRRHGVAYRTRTWIQVVLPDAGAQLAAPALARDLLAAAALDAGGIRADVATVSMSHSREEIVASSRELLDALLRVLADCESTSHRQPVRASDPSCWPATSC